MPWALFNRPSIQLGTLKAFLENRSDSLKVVTSHIYLETAAILGADLYHWISQNPWVSEALYAGLLFPEQSFSAESLTARYVRKADSKIKQAFDFQQVSIKLAGQLADWTSRQDWSQFSLIGFSVCFHQLFASLSAAKQIKEKYPDIKIVLGGSSCAANAGRSLLTAFDFIDFIIEGEGEKGLLALCDYLQDTRGASFPVNIIARQDAKQSRPQLREKESQLASLADLPVPDYQEYFAALQKWFSRAPFIPVLPVEFSRGCWWNKCSFCNLNLQWCGYRYKNAEQMLAEVVTLAKRHNCLDFTFTDNMLPPAASKHFFKMSRKSGHDLNFFAEIRSAKCVKELADMFTVYRRGGLTSIQVGIESLSNSLLKKMQKGISVIDNIANMRAAQENGIRLEGNLILQFPGSSQAEVSETLAVLDFIFPYPPLSLAAFFLGYDSPVYRKPSSFGIRAIVNHANNYRLLPKSTLAKLNLLVQDYRGDKNLQRKIWQPVAAKVTKWQQYHEKRQQDALHKPLLYYRDGGDFLIIRQELPDGRILHHRLKSTSRQIYLSCTRVRTDHELYAMFPNVRPEKINSFLADLQKKMILFSDKSKYLALAVHYQG